MDRSVAIKENAVEVLNKQLALRARKNQQGIIVLSSATEPYSQFEEELQVTRKILERILHYRFPVHIITRSDLVTRDLDILDEINKYSKAIVSFSFSTLDDDVAKIFEPGATPPSKRLIALKSVIDHGLYSGVNLMPLIPLITDTADDLERFYSAFSSLGVKYIMPASITLFGDGPSFNRHLMFRAVERYYPNLIDEWHKLFAYGYQVEGNYHKTLLSRFSAIQRKYNIPDRILI